MATISTLAVNLIARTSVFERKMKTSRKTLYGFQRAASHVQRNLMRLAGVFAAGFGVSRAVRELAEFEKQISMVSTMLDKQTMSYLPGYQRALQRLAIEFGEATGTLAKGLYDILSASIPPQHALDVLSVSTKAAKAGFTDTAVAADAITTILNSYGRSAEDAMWASDVLFATVKRGKTTFAELAPNIGKVLAVAATAGLRFEEVGAALATMTRAGLRTEIAVTALRSILSTFLTPTAASIEAAKQLGLELNTTTLRTIGLTGVLKKLRNATAEQVAQLIPNIRGLAGFSASLKQVEDQIYDLNLMMESAGRTQEAYEKATDNLSFVLDRARQSAAFFARGLGSTLSPAIEAVSNLLKDMGLRLQRNTAEWWAWRSGIIKGVGDVITALELLPSVQMLETFAMAKTGRKETLSDLLYKLADESWAEANREMNKYFDSLTGPKAAKGLGALPKIPALPAKTITTLSEAIEKLQSQVEYFNWSPLEKQIWELNKLAEGLPLEEQRLFNIEFQRFLDLATQLADLQYGEQLAKEAERIYKATRTPLEKYEGQIGRLHELLEAGVLNWETYGRAINLARKELEGIKAPRLPELQEIRPSQVSIPGLTIGADPITNRLDKTNQLLGKIDGNTSRTADAWEGCG